MFKLNMFHSGVARLPCQIPLPYVLHTQGLWCHLVKARTIVTGQRNQPGQIVIIQQNQAKKFFQKFHYKAVMQAFFFVTLPLTETKSLARLK